MTMIMGTTITITAMVILTLILWMGATRRAR